MPKRAAIPGEAHAGLLAVIHHGDQPRLKPGLGLVWTRSQWATATMTAVMPATGQCIEAAVVLVAEPRVELGSPPL
jgi:hypothetical protein